MPMQHTRGRWCGSKFVKDELQNYQTRGASSQGAGKPLDTGPGPVMLQAESAQSV